MPSTAAISRCVHPSARIRRATATLLGSGTMRHRASTSVPAEISLFQAIEQIRGRVHLTVVIDLLVASRPDHRAVLEREPIDGVLEVLLLHQHALERLRVEAEGGAAFESLL